MPVAQISLQNLFEKSKSLGSKDVILDVRNPSEFTSGHIPGALNIPASMVAESAQELSQYDHVYVHCKAGGRARGACQTLADEGLTNIVCLGDAGMDQWIESGFPVQK